MRSTGEKNEVCSQIRGILKRDYLYVGSWTPPQIISLINGAVVCVGRGCERSGGGGVNSICSSYFSKGWWLSWSSEGDDKV